jgi:hypothetical protein
MAKEAKSIMSATVLIPAHEEPLVDESVWNAWVQKGREREKSINRKMTTFCGFLGIALVVCYFVFLRGRP